MLHARVIHRQPSRRQRAHDINPAAWRLILVPSLQIGWARAEAQPAMNARQCFLLIQKIRRRGHRRSWEKFPSDQIRSSLVPSNSSTQPALLRSRVLFRRDNKSLRFPDVPATAWRPAPKASERSATVTLKSFLAPFRSRIARHTDSPPAPRSPVAAPTRSAHQHPHDCPRMLREGQSVLHRRNRPASQVQLATTIVLRVPLPVLPSMQPPCPKNLLSREAGAT